MVCILDCRKYTAAKRLQISSVGNLFMGGGHATTMKQTRRIGQLAQKFSSRYTDWRPNLLHGMSTAVFVGSRTVDSLLPPAGETVGRKWGLKWR